MKMIKDTNVFRCNECGVTWEMTKEEIEQAADDFYKCDCGSENTVIEESYYN